MLLRRELLRRAAALGLGTPAVALLLDACGRNIEEGGAAGDQLGPIEMSLQAGRKGFHFSWTPRIRGAFGPLAGPGWPIQAPGAHGHEHRIRGGLPGPTAKWAHSSARMRRWREDSSRDL
jgi:hypothetical protein